MKSIVRLLVVAVLLIFISIEIKAQHTYQFECLSASSEQVTLKIWDIKKAKRYKFKTAQKDAVRSVLFDGISKSKNCVNQKALLQSLEDKETFKTIELSFFKKNDTWINFVRNAVLDSAEEKKINGKSYLLYEISIAKNDLRHYLEEKKIIRPLNSIF